jgi:protein Tex
MVNESGASIYSASEVAREEFPDHDITVRGAVSIGRRLADPLAELVKIDAKSIGVGQYQHDVDQTKLKAGLDDVVMSCVNSVGVEVNTASKELLSYVSGLGPQLAKSIVEFRNQNGAFKSRSALKKVPRLGDKAFEQCAGFLRIRDAKNPLDASAVHPERYELVEKFAKDLGCTVKDLMTSNELRKKLDLKKYVTSTVGLPTLTDILAELEKPGRDPREKFEAFSFEDGIHEIKDLKVGMVLPGIVTNVTNFGAFVDVGVHQDGLVHISHLSDRFIKDPNQVIAVQQKVKVTVVEVDVPRKRIALSMKSDPFGDGQLKPAEQKSTPQAKPTFSKSQQKEKPSTASVKAETMEDKLAQLKNKFKS